MSKRAEMIREKRWNQNIKPKYQISNLIEHEIKQNQKQIDSAFEIIYSLINSRSNSWLKKDKK